MRGEVSGDEVGGIKHFVADVFGLGRGFFRNGAALNAVVAVLCSARDRCGRVAVEERLRDERGDCLGAVWDAKLVGGETVDGLVNERSERSSVVHALGLSRNRDFLLRRNGRIRFARRASYSQPAAQKLLHHLHLPPNPRAETMRDYTVQKASCGVDRQPMHAVIEEGAAYRFAVAVDGVVGHDVHLSVGCDFAPFEFDARGTDERPSGEVLESSGAPILLLPS